MPHYWEHVKWVWGARDMDEFMRISAGVTLEGVLDRVRVPFLVTYGEGDRQISVEYAKQTYAGMVNSPKRELKIFTAREGGVEHVSSDNMSFGVDFIADWISETLNNYRS